MENDPTYLTAFEFDNTAAYSPYFIQGRTEKTALLEHLRKERATLTLHLGGGEFFFLTMLIFIDTGQQRLVFDVARDNQLQVRAEAATRIIITTEFQNIKVQFRVPSLSKINFQGEAALTCAVPEKILRLQRREYFRMETSKIVPLVCQFTFKDKVYEWPLVDISVGGLALQGTVDAENLLTQGDMIEKCRLSIPDEGDITVDLQVCKILHAKNVHGNPYVRLGCEFVKLSNAREALISRYITQLERSRKAVGG